MTDYIKFINSTSNGRKMAPIGAIGAMVRKYSLSMISFHIGTPNSQCFPYTSITMHTKTGHQLILKDKELQEALGYMAASGYPPLMPWLLQLQKLFHDPPYARDQPDLNQVIVTDGSEDALCKILEMSVEAADAVLIAEPANPGLLSALRPLHARMIPIKMDQGGLNPDSLKEALDKCRQEYQDSKIMTMPKLLIIQPNHCNPLGITTTLERRKAIYQLACQFDFLIIEDDPYHFLKFGTDPSLPSFLSMDTEGRVLRLDSYPDIISPGLRLGILSGPKPLVQHIMFHISISSGHASTLSQALFLKFFQYFGLDGFLDHTKTVASFYEGQYQKMLKAAEKHLTGLAEWNLPDGGLFLWIKMLDVDDTEKMIMEKGLQKKIMLAPGNLFMCNDTRPTSYLRASFSLANEEEMNEGFKTLAKILVQKNTNKQNAEIQRYDNAFDK